MADPAMPLRHQMIDGEPHAPFVVRYDRRYPIAKLETVDQDDGHAAVEAISDHVVVTRHGRQYQPIDALVEKVVDKRDLLRGVVAGIGHDRRITFACERLG